MTDVYNVTQAAKNGSPQNNLPVIQNVNNLTSAPVIGVVSGRGGSGKSTLAFGLAHALASRHQLRVALMDLDPQGSCTVYAGAQPSRSPLGAAAVDVHGISLYTGGESLARATLSDLRRHISRAAVNADVVIADLSPSIGDTAHTCMLHHPARLLLVVAWLEPGTMQPVAKLTAMANSAGVPYQIVGNRDNARLTTAATLAALQGQHDASVSAYILHDVPAAPESVARRTPLTLYRPKSSAALAVYAIAREIVLAGVLR